MVGARHRSAARRITRCPSASNLAFRWSLALAALMAGACTDDAAPRPSDRGDAQVAGGPTSGRDGGPASGTDARAEGPDSGDPFVDVGQAQLPDYAVSWSMLTPESLVPGDPVAVTVMVRNMGPVDAPPSRLLWDLLPTTGGSSLAPVLSQVELQGLSAGDSMDVELTATAPSMLGVGAYVLRVQVDPEGKVMELDETNNEVLSAITVSGVEVSPTQLDFGVTRVGCGEQTRSVTVTNQGSSEATLMNTTISGTSEFTLTAPMLPGTLRPGASLMFDVTYEPTDSGIDSGQLFLDVEQGGSLSLMVALTGVGDAMSGVTDTFTQNAPATPKADILLVIDNSRGMGAHHEHLVEQWEAFEEYAEDTNLDYRIAATTTDMGREGGRFVGQAPVITPMTARPDSVFEEIIDRGTGGSGNEQGIAASVAALTPPVSTMSPNVGFLRGDAATVVVYLSNENDHSSGTPAAALASLRQAAPVSLRANAIIGPRRGCRGDRGAAQHGVRYEQVATETQGRVVSICGGDVADALTELGSDLGLFRRFTLSADARPDSVEITVNGVAVPQMDSNGDRNWSVEGARTVVFEDAPASGAAVEITFEPVC